MKNRILKTITILLFVNIVIYSQEKSIRYSEKWKTMTVAQRWEAMNIPENELREMTTNELIEHCIDFDFMWDIFNHPTYEIGLNLIINNHNGLKELLHRRDAGSLLLNYYKKINLNEITNIDELYKQGEFVGQIFFLELFLSRTSVLNQFKSRESSLIKSVLNSYDTALKINRDTNENFYCGYSIGTKILLLKKVLTLKEGKNPEKIPMDLSKLSAEESEKIILNSRRIN